MSDQGELDEPESIDDWDARFARITALNASTAALQARLTARLKGRAHLALVGADGKVETLPPTPSLPERLADVIEFQRRA